MSDLVELDAELQVNDLTMYGCPMHYIKAKQLLSNATDNSPILIEVNNGKAVTEMLNSLRKDHYVCSVENEGQLTTIIRVTKNND